MDFNSHYFSYSFFGISKLAASILALSVGVWVVSRNPKSKPHLSFFLITLTSSLWMFCFAMMNLVSSDKSAMSWLKWGYLTSVLFISPSVYFFTTEWTERRSKHKTTAIFFFAALVIGLTIFFRAEEIFAISQNDIWRFNYFRNNLIGRVYLVITFTFFFLLALLAFNNIYKAWKNSISKKDRIQYRNFLIGFIVGYTGSVDLFAANGVNIYPFGYISFTLFLIIIAYTIVRHQFLEINALIKRISLITLIYSILFALTLPLAFPFFKKILNQSSNLAWISIGLSIGLGLIFSLGPLIYAYLVRHSFWLKGNLSTGLAHELKSPLASIQGALDIIFRSLNKPNPDQQKALEYLEMIQNNTERLQEFTQSLLNVAKAGEGSIFIQKSREDLVTIIRNVTQSFKPILDQKEITLILELPEACLIDIDGLKIAQVISNLISNGIKFSSSKSKIIITLEKQFDQIILSVLDFGCGLNKTDLDRIFDRFYQVKESSKGTGIGLTIAKAWVEAHGGKIWAESEGLNRGTTVAFTLPI